MADTLQELFEHELRDIYDAEHKLARALDTMAKKTPNESISQAFEDHRETTKDQIKRLETVFDQVDKKPRREPCKGINGLIEEFSEFVSEEEPSEPVMNAFAIGAALKVEHYEIVAYQSLIRLAGRLQLTEAVDLLSTSLIEEQQTAQTLETMAEQLAGPLARSARERDEPVVLADVTEGEVVLDEREAVARSEPLL